MKSFMPNAEILWTLQILELDIKKGELHPILTRARTHTNAHALCSICHYL